MTLLCKNSYFPFPPSTRVVQTRPVFEPTNLRPKKNKTPGGGPVYFRNSAEREENRGAFTHVALFSAFSSRPFFFSSSSYEALSGVSRTFFSVFVYHQLDCEGVNLGVPFGTNERLLLVIIFFFVPR